MFKSTTPDKAIRHEALYLRLVALLGRVDVLAARHPDAIVPEAMRVLAEGALFDCRPFAAAHPRRELPVAAPVYAGLAAQLGAALAGLDSFEGGHTHWDDARKCFVWALVAGGTQPVKRLKPKTVAKTEQQSALMAKMRHKLARNIDARREQDYERGRRDGAMQAAQALAEAEAGRDDPTYPRPQNPA